MYAPREGCDPTKPFPRDAYLGILDVQRRERAFRVAAAHPVFLQLVYTEQGEMMISCRDYVGFVPQQGESYTLELHIDRHRGCSTDLRSAHGAVERLEPTACFAP